eukprot:15467055-Alexandrium_andersonii.AAC.1
MGPPGRRPRGRLQRRIALHSKAVSARPPRASRGPELRAERQVSPRRHWSVVQGRRGPPQGIDAEGSH